MAFKLCFVTDRKVVLVASEAHAILGKVGVVNNTTIISTFQGIVIDKNSLHYRNHNGKMRWN